MSKEINKSGINIIHNRNRSFLMFFLVLVVSVLCLVFISFFTASCLSSKEAEPGLSQDLQNSPGSSENGSEIQESTGSQPTKDTPESSKDDKHAVSKSKPTVDYSETSVTVKNLSSQENRAENIIEYRILVKNTGSIKAENIMLNCPVPRSTGYVESSAMAKDGLEINPEKTKLSWKIERLLPGHEKLFSFRVFIADYVTFEDEIIANFYISDKGKTFEIKTPALIVRPYNFINIVCMGDSQIVFTKWPGLLKQYLENYYPFSRFNVISSAYIGEMAEDAIKRFDDDVRIYKPDIIILGYGSNDAGQEPDLFRYHMDILLKQAASTEALVFVHGIGYIDREWPKWPEKANYTIFNNILESQLCPEYGAVYVDIYKEMSKDPKIYIENDGLHYSSKGAELVAQQILKAVLKHLDKNGNIIKNRTEAG